MAQDERPLISFDPPPDGTPVFAGTKVPVAELFDRFADGERLSDFLRDHEGVTEVQAGAAIKLAKAALERLLRDPRKFSDGPSGDH